MRAERRSEDSVMARLTRARASYVLMSPRKARLVLDLVRGRYVDDAVAILKAVPNRAARVVEKLVNSAAANAEANLHISRDSLKVKGAFADQGPSLKRFQPRAMGRAYRILKRTSHITVIVEEAEPRPSVKRLAHTVTKAEARGRRKRGEEEAQSGQKRGRARKQAEQAAPQVEEATAPAEEQPVAEAPAVETPQTEDSAPGESAQAEAKVTDAGATGEEPAGQGEPKSEDKGDS